MIKYKRIFTIVIDSLGVGAMEDAAAYGDAGTDTLGHISQRVEEFHIPNLQSLGLANLHPLKQVEPVTHPEGYYMKLREASAGKETSRPLTSITAQVFLTSRSSHSAAAAHPRKASPRMPISHGTV